MTILAMANHANATSFIRDTEIENTIRVYSKPIFEAAGLHDGAVKVFIINDDALNAFVTNGQKIFMNTGTLRFAESPEQVMGVIAHEAGHITGGHLAKLSNQVDRANLGVMASILVGIPIAVLSGNGELGAAITSLGMTGAERDLLRYSRVHEQAADQAGVEYLAKAGISNRGLLEFMSKLERKAKLYQGGTADPYMQTHPLTSDRIDFLDFSHQHEKLDSSKLPESFYYLHRRMVAKLDGYLDEPALVLAEYKGDDQIDLYAKAIAMMRLAKWDEALSFIDQLLTMRPNDPFFWELKGEIYKTKGDLDGASDAYLKATEILPWAGLIQLEYAEILLAMENKNLHDDILTRLEIVKSYEPNLPRLWRSLATIYSRMGEEGLLALAQAEGSLRMGNLQIAKAKAKEAIDHLNAPSSAHQRARDIINKIDLATIQ